MSGSGSYMSLDALSRLSGSGCRGTVSLGLGCWVRLRVSRVYNPSSLWAVVKNYGPFLGALNSRCRIIIGT